MIMCAEKKNVAGRGLERARDTVLARVQERLP